MRVYNTGDTEQVSIPGEIWVGDLPNKRTFTNAEFGISPRILINPNSFELLLNGRQLVKAGDADLPTFVCEGAEGYDEDSCIANSGAWVPSGQDYSLIFVDSVVTGIKFAQPLESRDVVTIRWFNNDIGTVMEWDGVGGIKEHTDKIYLNNEEEVTLVNRIEYTDYNNPTQKTARKVADTFSGRLLIYKHSLMLFIQSGQSTKTRTTIQTQAIIWALVSGHVTRKVCSLQVGQPMHRIVILV